jgi:hypothetical protein
MKAYRPSNATLRVARILRSLHYVVAVKVIPGPRLPGGRRPPTFRITYQSFESLLGTHPERTEDITAEQARDWAEAEMYANRHLAAKIDGDDFPQQDWAEYVQSRGELS